MGDVGIPRGRILRCGWVNRPNGPVVFTIESTEVVIPLDFGTAGIVATAVVRDDGSWWIGRITDGCIHLPLWPGIETHPQEGHAYPVVFAHAQTIEEGTITDVDTVAEGDFASKHVEATVVTEMDSCLRHRHTDGQVTIKTALWRPILVIGIPGTDIPHRDDDALVAIGHTNLEFIAIATRQHLPRRKGYKPVTLNDAVPVGSPFAHQPFAGGTDRICRRIPLLKDRWCICWLRLGAFVILGTV